MMMPNALPGRFRTFVAKATVVAVLIPAPVPVPVPLAAPSAAPQITAQVSKEPLAPLYLRHDDPYALEMEFKRLYAKLGATTTRVQIIEDQHPPENGPDWPSPDLDDIRDERHWFIRDFNIVREPLPAGEERRFSIACARIPAFSSYVMGELWVTFTASGEQPDVVSDFELCGSYNDRLLFGSLDDTYADPPKFWRWPWVLGCGHASVTAINTQSADASYAPPPYGGVPGPEGEGDGDKPFYPVNTGENGDLIIATARLGDENGITQVCVRMQIIGWYLLRSVYNYEYGCPTL